MVIDIDKRKLISINKKLYHVSKINQKDYFHGVEIVLSRVLKIPLPGIGIRLKEKLVFITHQRNMLYKKDKSNEISFVWYQIPFEINTRNYSYLLSRSTLVKMSSKTSSFLSETLKKFKRN